MFSPVSVENSILKAPYKWDLNSVPISIREAFPSTDSETGKPNPGQQSAISSQQYRFFSCSQVPTDCESEDMDCPTGMSLSWEGTAEIQTGDVLLVRIDDRTLRQDLSQTNLSR